VTQFQEVCRVKQSLSASADVKPAIIFELTGIDIIPLMNYNYTDKKKVEEVSEKLEKYLTSGFYFAMHFDITTNA